MRRRIALGVVSAVDMPTRQAFVVDLVGQDDLMNGIALNSAVFNTTRVVGPALAGLLLGAFGAADLLRPQRSLLHAGAAWLERHADQGRAETRWDASARPASGCARGWRTSAARRPCSCPIVLAGMIAIFGMNFNVWAPLLARDALDIGASGFGLLMSSLGVGSLIGALTLAFAWT